MRKPMGSPSLGEELGTLADLYLTYLWMLRQRLHYGPGWQYRGRRAGLEITASEKVPDKGPGRGPTQARHE